MLTRRRALGVLGAGLALGSVGTSQADEHEAEVSRDGSTWYAESHGEQVYDGDDMLDAIQAAVDGLTAGRTQKETVVVHDSGTVGPHEWDGDLKAVDLPSYTVLDVRGTITVEDEGEDLIVPVRAKSVESIEIPEIAIEGNPRYGIWIQSCSDVTLGEIEMDLHSAETIGLGVRVDDGDDSRSANVSLDYAWIENGPGHAVETYGVDEVDIGEVYARDVGGCGLLLNDTADATVDLVDAVRADEGGGYAGFRCANDAGPNITVNEVSAVDCGRGIFTVSGSSGIEIYDVDVEGCSVLIQDTRDTVIDGGTIGPDSGIRIDSRSDDTHPHTRNVTVQNLDIVENDIGVNETGPDTEENAIVDNYFCDNDTDIETFADSTDVSGNTFCDDGGGDGPIEDGTYVIENVNSGKALDVLDGGTDNGDNVVQWDSWGGEMQQWTVEHQGDGVYALLNVNSDKALDVEASGTEDGDTVIQWEDGGDDNQRWTIEAQGDGEYALLNVNSGKALDVEDGGTEDGDDVIQWEYWGGDNQHWTFDPV